MSVTEIVFMIMGTKVYGFKNCIILHSWVLKFAGYYSFEGCRCHVVNALGFGIEGHIFEYHIYMLLQNLKIKLTYNQLS